MASPCSGDLPHAPSIYMAKRGDANRRARWLGRELA
jgi:hypothetical protein